MYDTSGSKDVDPAKKVEGVDWCVTQPFPAGGAV